MGQTESHSIFFLIASCETIVPYLIGDRNGQLCKNPGDSQGSSLRNGKGGENGKRAGLGNNRVFGGRGFPVTRSEPPPSPDVHRVMKEAVSTEAQMETKAKNQK